MSNVVSFKEKEFKNRYTSDFRNLFSKLNDYYKDIIDSFDLEDEIEKEMYDEVMNTYSLFDGVKKKVDKNKVWLKNDYINEFYDYFDECTDAGDEICKVEKEMLYIHIVDVTKGKILKFDSNYIAEFINVLLSYEDDIYFQIPNIVSMIMDKRILNIISSSKDVFIDLNDIIGMVTEGYNILEIENAYKNEETFDSNLDELDKIYYRYKDMLHTYDKAIEKRAMVTLSKIKKIKSFNKINQNKFVNLVECFELKGYKIVPNIKFLSSLIDLFMMLGNSRISKLSASEIYENTLKLYCEEIDYKDIKDSIENNNVIKF